MIEIAKIGCACVGYALIASFYVFCAAILGATYSGGIVWW
jgi:hypothetical protein